MTLVWSSTLAVGMALSDSMEPVNEESVHVGLINHLLVALEVISTDRLTDN